MEILRVNFLPVDYPIQDEGLPNLGRLHVIAQRVTTTLEGAAAVGPGPGARSRRRRRR